MSIEPKTQTLFDLLEAASDACLCSKEYSKTCRTQRQTPVKFSKIYSFPGQLIYFDLNINIALSINTSRTWTFCPFTFWPPSLKGRIAAWHTLRIYMWFLVVLLLRLFTLPSRNKFHPSTLWRFVLTCSVMTRSSISSIGKSSHHPVFGATLPWKPNKPENQHRKQALYKISPS